MTTAAITEDRSAGNPAAARLIEAMQDYNHQVGFKLVGECLPLERNRVTLADEKDGYGLPLPRVTYSYCDNDNRLIGHALGFMRQALGAIDAYDLFDETDDTCHMHGTARMGDDPATSVVDADAARGIFQICGCATARSSRPSAASTRL